MASPAQVRANTENAQHSTGPKTDSGKLISKLNAFKHGLTGNTVLLPTEDMHLYESFRADLIASLAPLGAQEQQLAQRIADTNWRLNRIPAHEANLFALAQLEPLPEHLAALEDSPARTALIETNALITHERHLRNLHLQEQRLNRELRHISAELNQLQVARLTALFEQRKRHNLNEAFYPDATETEELLAAELPKDVFSEAIPNAIDHLPADDEPFDPNAFGFDFANVSDEELDSSQRIMRQLHRATLARMKARS